MNCECLQTVEKVDLAVGPTGIGASTSLTVCFETLSTAIISLQSVSAAGHLMVVTLMIADLCLGCRRIE